MQVSYFLSAILVANATSIVRKNRAKGEEN